MTLRLLPCSMVVLAACSSVPADLSDSSGGGGTGPDNTAACEPSFSPDTIHLAAGTALSSGEETTLCLRWTTPEALDIHGFVGTLGPAGHHALVLARSGSLDPDGLAPCSEPELMDSDSYGEFDLLAGVSYETSGQRIDFPSSPVQVGLRVPAGTQLIFDAHFLNTGAGEIQGCASIDLSRGKPVVAPLVFRTVLPKEQYALAIPAHSSIDVSYEEPSGGRYRVAAAASHMHEGGTYFRMSIKETDQTLYETTSWAEPRPALYDAQKILVEDGQTFRLDCSFTNESAVDQRFPDQMCVGAMYLLPCTYPGAC